MGREPIIPRFLPLVGVALALNLTIAGALVLAERVADPGDGRAEMVMAEVEILLAQPGAQGGVYLVRVQRLLKGDLGSDLLRVRFGRNVRPEGIGLGSLEGNSFRPGQRLFVVLERDGNCAFQVRNLWLHGAGGKITNTRFLPFDGLKPAVPTSRQWASVWPRRPTTPVT